MPSGVKRWGLVLFPDHLDEASDEELQAIIDELRRRYHEYQAAKAKAAADGPQRHQDDQEGPPWRADRKGRGRAGAGRRRSSSGAFSCRRAQH